MNNPSVVDSLEQALAELPVLDVHTHLCGWRLGARGLHDILLYHMVVSDLYAAGCPSGARLTQFPNWPTKEEAHQRIREALPYVRFIQNTSGWWGVRIILRDLYDWRSRSRQTIGSGSTSWSGSGPMTGRGRVRF